MAKIIISLEMPTPEAPIPASPTTYQLTPEERVQDAIESVNSGQDSHRDWLFLNKVYQSIQGKNSPRAQNLCKMIKPVLSKFGYHGMATNDKGTN